MKLTCKDYIDCDKCNYNMCEDCPAWHNEEEEEADNEPTADKIS